MGRTAGRRNKRDRDKKIPSSRFWAGLKSATNNRLTLTRRNTDRELNQKPDQKATLRLKAEKKRETKRLKNIELKSRGG